MNSEKRVWLIRAELPNGDQSFGSAVLVLLEHLEREALGTGEWAPKTPPDIRRYLLTCAHVVSGADSIRAWAPGRPYAQAPLGANLGAAVAAAPWLRAHETNGSALSADDWTLLEFREAPAWVSSQEYVARWDAVPRDGQEMDLVGFPLGAAAWGDLELAIRPISSRGFRYQRHDEESGFVAITGGESRDGMSGGGLFSSDGTLVALHRAAVDLALERRVIDASQIVRDLGLVGCRPSFGAAALGTSCWPNTKREIEAIPWLVSNLSQARTEFMKLLTTDSGPRLMRLEGPSATGKTRITSQMQDALRSIPAVRSGRFSFKGGGALRGEMRLFAEELNVESPDLRDPVSGLAAILASLRTQERSTVLIFDTYEQAGASADWFERSLLHALLDAPWLRVVIAGQVVPRSTSARWLTIAADVISCTQPTARDWVEYGKVFAPWLDSGAIEELFKHKPLPHLLAQVLDPARR